MAILVLSLISIKCSTLSNRNLKHYDLSILRWMAFVNVAGKTRRTIKCTGAMFTRVNFTCVDPRVPIEASLIGETITANVTGKCFWSDRVIEDMFSAVCEAAEDFAAVLARIRPIIVVIVHMFPQVCFASECFVAYLAYKLSLACPHWTRRSNLGFHRCDANFAVFAAGFRAVRELIAGRRRLRRSWLLLMRRARSVPTTVRS